MNQDLQAARVYGEAFFQVVESRGEDLGEVARRVRELRTALRETPGFLDFLGAPNVSREQKEALIRQVVAKLEVPMLLNFLLLLLQRGRLDLMQSALREFQLMAERKLGIARGRVATAKELSQDEKDRLKKSLEQYTGTNLSMTWVVQPELIGGVLFKSGDLLIDSSLRSQLQRLRASLMAPRGY